MNKTLAPIILFVYNRPWHTRQTLEALKRNRLADESVLFIFSDGPKQDANGMELKKIMEVRALIKEENWCGEIKIIEREKNLGLAESVINGVSEIIDRHGQVIVLEDDIVTGKYFLHFMNQALKIYKPEEKVFGISGYKYPSARKIQEETYFLPIASSWSFATWKDRWDKVNFNGRELLREIEDGNFQQELDFGGYTFYNMLKDQIEGRNDSWAIRFYTSMFLEKAYFLYPNVSLVQNIGFDDSGVHCSKENYFSRVKAETEKIRVEKKSVKLDYKLLKSLTNSITKSQSKKDGKSILRKLIKRLRGTYSKNFN